MKKRSLSDIIHEILNHNNKNIIVEHFQIGYNND